MIWSRCLLKRLTSGPPLGGCLRVTHLPSVRLPVPVPFTHDCADVLFNPRPLAAASLPAGSNRLAVLACVRINREGRCVSVVVGCIIITVNIRLLSDK